MKILNKTAILITAVGLLYGAFRHQDELTLANNKIMADAAEVASKTLDNLARESQVYKKERDRADAAERELAAMKEAQKAKENNTITARVRAVVANWIK